MITQWSKLKDFIVLHIYSVCYLPQDKVFKKDLTDFYSNRKGQAGDVEIPGLPGFTEKLGICHFCMAKFSSMCVSTFSI